MGVIIDDELSWNSHVSRIASIIIRNIGVIRCVRSKINSKTHGYFITQFTYYCTSISILLHSNLGHLCQTKYKHPSHALEKRH